MKRFTELPVMRIYRHRDDITGNLTAGEVFVGEVFTESHRSTATDAGTFMVISSNGYNHCLNLLTGQHHPGDYYVRINTDVEPSLELK